MAKKKTYFKYAFGYTVPLYGVALTIFTDIDEAAEAGFEISPNHGAFVAVASNEQGEGVFAIFRPEVLTSPNTLAHEAVHAAWRVLDMVGITIDSENHEALAYLTGWMVDCMTESADRTTQLRAKQDNTAAQKE